MQDKIMGCIAISASDGISGTQLKWGFAATGKSHSHLSCNLSRNKIRTQIHVYKGNTA
jgi:hypothetical protein